MKYLLGNLVYYNEELRVLTSNSDEIRLPVAAARLLTLLIINNYSQVSRHEILDSVWEQHGLVASDHNLNRNISILRKSLQDLGLKDVIETIPKQGFIFHCDIQKVNAPEKVECKKNDKNKFSIRKIKFNLCLLVCFFISFVFVFICYVKSENVMYKYKTIEKCDIYIDNELTHKDNVDVFLNTILGKEIIKSCKTSPKIIYFDDNKASLRNKSYSTHVALCEKEKMEAVYECENFINHNGV